MQLLTMKQAEYTYLRNLTRKKCREYASGKIKHNTLNMDPFKNSKAIESANISVDSKVMNCHIDIEIIQSSKHYFIATVCISGKYSIFNYYI
jgi:hypothetical protein